jgi:hypothetical protein
MPAKPKTRTKAIVVAGDVTVDWNIARARTHLGKLTRYQYIWGSDIATRACSQSGGAALLTEMLTVLCEKENAPAKQSFNVFGPTIPKKALNNPSYGRYPRSYSVWSAYPQTTGHKKMVWRASEFWGTDHAPKPDVFKEPPGSPGDPWSIVLDDANLGIRDQQEAWPEGVKNPSSKTEWVIAKIANPVAQGPLWEHIKTHFADRLIVVISVNDLRKANMHIGYELSWEQISGEVVEAVTNDPELSKPLAVVVVLGTTGAIIANRMKGNYLVFDPYAQEENWKIDHPGTCIGYSSCYVAALIHQLMNKSKKHDLQNAVRRGVFAARALHLAGYGEGVGGKLVDLHFPAETVIDALNEENIPLATVKLPEIKEDWTILSLRKDLEISKVAANVVKFGPETSLRDLPLEKIRRWSSIDRTEIENIRSLRNIMTEYVVQARPSRPLSLAVFGPPGSGKSFAIKEVARGLMPGQLSQVEFNLSQFESPDELPAAFHRVRDCVLRHELPLVFWDEFDTPLQGKELGWLRYFLVPMQDGEFHERGVSHPLGPAIFVFAGGTNSSMESFRETAGVNPAAKGRDFTSRLRGFLDVLGPNPQGKKDEGFMLRRALLLRSLLMIKAKHLFDSKNFLNIDEGVLRALLLIDHYRHGARSMECIIDMSSLSGKLMFERSCLPAQHQLDLHVDATQFLRLTSGVTDDSKK